MTRRAALPLLVACLLALSGWVAGLAASAVGMAARSAAAEQEHNQHLQPAAANACSVHASQYGALHIIDVEQRTTSKIIVWGTVDEGQERRSFECVYGANITAFKLRSIPKRR